VVAVTVPPSAVTAPCHFGQQRIDRLAGVEVGLDVGDQPHRAVPGLCAVGVVQQDQSAEGIALGLLGHDGRLGMAYFGAEGVAERRQPLRRPDRAELDLRSHGGGVHRSDRFPELSRFGGGHRPDGRPSGQVCAQARRIGRRWKPDGQRSERHGSIVVDE